MKAKQEKRETTTHPSKQEIEIKKIEFQREQVAQWKEQCEEHYKKQMAKAETDREKEIAKNNYDTEMGQIKEKDNEWLQKIEKIKKQK